MINGWMREGWIYALSLTDGEMKWMEGGRKKREEKRGIERRGMERKGSGERDEGNSKERKVKGN